jgi:iron-sulfur cluster repair protein YtfE (RIC family)
VIYAAAVSEAAPETLGVEPTPDDGTRLSSTRVWDEAARPRWATPPAAAAYTRSGRATSRHLIQIHDMLRSELASLRDLIAQVRDGLVSVGEARSQINEMTMRQNNWTMGAYCQSYCRVVTHHHFAEDAMVFPHLRARETDLGPVLDRLSEEHVVIHEVLDSVDRALVAYIAQPEALTELQEAVDLLTDTLLSHLAYEESQLLEPLARYGFYDSPF